MITQRGCGHGAPCKSISRSADPANLQGRRSEVIVRLAVLVIVVVVCMVFAVRAYAESSAIDVLRDSQENRFLETDDDQQNWMVFWLCREMDSLRKTIAENEAARREDDKELRAQLWKLALLVGGGGAVGGVGGAAIVKRKRRG